MKPILWLLTVLLTFTGCQNKNNVKLKHVDEFQNQNHPQIAYWFFDEGMLSPKVYRGKIDTFAEQSKFTFLFLTPRKGADFYEVGKVHPILEDLVEYAHSRNLKVGIQFWQKNYDVAPENMERMIQEGEVGLDQHGEAYYKVMAHEIPGQFLPDVATPNLIRKSEVFKVFIFRKSVNGFYEPGTLIDVTNEVLVKTSGATDLEITIHAGPEYANYTAYFLTQHYYNFCSNFSEESLENLINIMRAYSDIPFDGVGIDEFRNLSVIPYWEIEDTPMVFRDRMYSQGMEALYKQMNGSELHQALFDMRYAPEGKPEVRIKAINTYMNCVRKATLKAEEAIYDMGKELYGKKTFIGLHNTFHNGLETGEVWTTGFNWWNTKRDYGHSDEETPLPTKLGIELAYPMNVMYNMYYSKDLKTLASKAIIDARYGIRTHYHAINDKHGWGYSLEKPEALSMISAAENAVRVLNTFNPASPDIRLLVVFGAEAQVNWYPDENKRGKYDINTLGVEDMAVQLWNEGYMNALVPSDLIVDGRLTLNEQGKPVLNGHVFDALVFLYPEYSHNVTLAFLNNYVDRGGKLMVEGSASYNFEAQDISSEWKKIAEKAVLTSFNVDEVGKLGINRNSLADGIRNSDGSYTFSSTSFLYNNLPSTFSFTDHGYRFSGDYRGIAAIKTNENGEIEKLAVSGFSYLVRNGEDILRLNTPANVFIEKKGKHYELLIADKGKEIQIVKNYLGKRGVAK